MVDLITPKRLFLSVPHGAYRLEELLLLLLKRFIFLSRRKINPTKSLLRTDTGRFFQVCIFISWQLLTIFPSNRLLFDAQVCLNSLFNGSLLPAIWWRCFACYALEVCDLWRNGWSMKKEKLLQYEMPFKEKNIARDEAVGGQSVPPLGIWRFEIQIWLRGGRESASSLMISVDERGGEWDEMMDLW